MSTSIIRSLRQTIVMTSLESDGDFCLERRVSRAIRILMAHVFPGSDFLMTWEKLLKEGNLVDGLSRNWEADISGFLPESGPASQMRWQSVPQGRLPCCSSVTKEDGLRIEDAEWESYYSSHSGDSLVTLWSLEDPEEYVIGIEFFRSSRAKEDALESALEEIRTLKGVWG